MTSVMLSPSIIAKRNHENIAVCFFFWCILPLPMYINQIRGIEPRGKPLNRSLKCSYDSRAVIVSLSFLETLAAKWFSSIPDFFCVHVPIPQNEWRFSRQVIARICTMCPLRRIQMIFEKMRSHKYFEKWQYFRQLDAGSLCFHS